MQQGGAAAQPGRDEGVARGLAPAARRRAPDEVARAGVEPVLALQALAGEVALGVDDGLRLARRAAREGHQARVLGAELGRRRGGRVTPAAPGRPHRPPAPARLAQDRLVALVADDDRRIGDLEPQPQVLGAQLLGAREDHVPLPEARHHRDDPLRTIADEREHDVAAPQAHGVQAGRERPRVRRDLAEGPLPPGAVAGELDERQASRDGRLDDLTREVHGRREGSRGAGSLRAPVDLRQLETFAAVARHGHVTRAADALHLTQPAVSQQVRRLEQELGVLLLTRTPQGVELTPAGADLLERADAILAQVAAARAAMDEHAGVVRGRRARRRDGGRRARAARGAGRLPRRAPRHPARPAPRLGRRGGRAGAHGVRRRRGRRRPRGRSLRHGRAGGPPAGGGAAARPGRPRRSAGRGRTGRDRRSRRPAAHPARARDRAARHGDGGLPGGGLQPRSAGRGGRSGRGARAGGRGRSAWPWCPHRGWPGPGPGRPTRRWPRPRPCTAPRCWSRRAPRRRGSCSPPGSPTSWAGPASARAPRRARPPGAPAAGRRRACSRARRRGRGRTWAWRGRRTAPP